MARERLDPRCPPPGRVGIFSGAGLSDVAPASIPMGNAFHRRLRELCLARSAPYAGDLVDAATLDAIRTSRLNLLARIENTSPGAGSSAIQFMTVAVPNECHLLAALHLAHGGLHLTMNFDDGIEQAYALLSGDSELPAGAKPIFHQALQVWRDRFPNPSPALRVVSRSQEIGSALPGHSILVKLHGSLGRHAEGLTLPMPSMTDEPDPGDLGMDRKRAFDALAAEGFVLVTGFSGTDLASCSALLSRLAPGRFWWIAPKVEADVRRRVAAIDPGQPMAGPSVEALRTTLAIDLPAWPRRRAPGPAFDDRLNEWAARLAPEVAAEAIAWALMDAAHVDEAVEIFRRLVRGGAGARTQIRLADALARRRWPGDARSARHTFLRTAWTRPDQGAGTARWGRSYSRARWLESVGAGYGMAPPIVTRSLACTALIASVAVSTVGGSSPDPTAPIRAATVASGIVLSGLERDLPAILGRPPLRPLAQRMVAVASAAARRVLDAWAHAPSGRRRAILERQAVELETIGALLRDELPPPTTFGSLRRLSVVFEHVSDRESQADTAGTRALAAFAARDVQGAVMALREATRLRPEPIGVVSLARSLLDMPLRHATVLDAERGAPIARRRHTGRRGDGRDAEIELAAFVERLPKVEVHLHLEGSVTPATLAALARRNGDLRVPWTMPDIERWYEFRGYQDFLNSHLIVSDQLHQPEDFVQVVTELGAALAREKVRYAEVAVAVDAPVRRSLCLDEVFAALEEGRHIVEAQNGVRLRWCTTAGSRRGPAAVMRALETVLAHRPVGVISFGLVGLESSVARAQFAPVFELAAGAGLHRVVDAGETAGPWSIWQAIDVLGAERIGHGIRCLGDPALVERLRRESIPLEVCPSSNVRTGIVPSLRAHPLPRLLAAGLLLTLNTDHPAMFGARLGDIFLKVAKTFHLGPAEIADLARNAVGAAFMAPAVARAILDEIDDVDSIRS